MAVVGFAGFFVGVALATLELGVAFTRRPTGRDTTNLRSTAAEAELRRWWRWRDQGSTSTSFYGEQDQTPQASPQPGNNLQHH
uniref:Uncharacterized protein n=1 Tax=Oryza punctata TaxID=4537 RepID=A0A0E0MI99_ORYPU